MNCSSTLFIFYDDGSIVAKLTVMRSFTLLFIGNWKSELLKVVDVDQLPVHWGGNATDPDGDPCCKSKVNFELRVQCSPALDFKFCHLAIT